MHVGKLVQRGLAQTIFLIVAALWLSTLVTLVVASYAPSDSPADAWRYWQTAVYLLVTLPVLAVYARWAFRAERRIGPRVPDADDEDPADRHHRGLDGQIPPPERW